MDGFIFSISDLLGFCLTKTNRSMGAPNGMIGMKQEGRYIDEDQMLSAGFRPVYAAWREYEIN